MKSNELDLVIFLPPPHHVVYGNGICRVDRRTAAAVERYVVGRKLPSGILFTGSEEFSKVGDFQKNDWYELQLTPDGITIRGAHERAVFYAVKTLHQLLVQFPDGLVPSLTIEDWADIPVRAVMLDVSRDRVPAIQTLYSLIEMWSMLKYNQLQLYMEHTFAYKGHEQVWKESSPFTSDEIRNIDQFCRKRGIELVPNQNSFGHMERWLKHDQYRHLAEAPNGFTDPWGVYRSVSTTLDPTNRQVFPFLEDLFDQLLPNFSSDLVNAGGDEPWELGMGSSRKVCEEDGVDRVYTEFLVELHTMMQKRGKRMMVWADILMKYPHIVSSLPKDVILVDWGYEAGHPFEEEGKILAESGYDFYICVGTSSWNSIGGRWDNAKANIHKGAKTAFDRGAQGLMITEWGDNGHFQQIPVQLPGYVYASAAAWNFADADVLEMESALGQILTFLGVDKAEKQLSRALMILESIGEVSGRSFHNGTLPGILLIDHLAPYYRKQLEHFIGYSFTKEIALLDEADKLIMPVLKVQDSLFIDELRLTSALLRFSCRLGRERLAAAECKTEHIPQNERQDLARQLSECIAEYKRLWMLRSRPGGLKESCERLESLKALLLL
jgi:hexosaminidase